METERSNKEISEEIDKLIRRYNILRDDYNGLLSELKYKNNCLIFVSVLLVISIFVGSH